MNENLGVNYSNRAALSFSLLSYFSQVSHEVLHTSHHEQQPFNGASHAEKDP